MTAATNEPTMAEVVRQLAAITQQLDRITRRLETDYVRRDLYEAQRGADRDDVKDTNDRIGRMEKRQDKADAQRGADRRLIITAFVAPIITALIVLYVSAQVGGR